MWRLIELICEFFDAVNSGVSEWDVMIIRMLFLLILAGTGIMIGIKIVHEGYPGYSSQWEQLENMIEHHSTLPGKSH